MTNEEVRIAVRLTPRARGEGIVGWVEAEGEARVLRVRVQAPALEGRANAALVRFLSLALGLPSRDVAVVRGEKSRDKVVAVRGLSASEVRRRLKAAAGG